MDLAFATKSDAHEPSKALYGLLARRLYGGQMARKKWLAKKLFVYGIAGFQLPESHE